MGMLFSTAKSALWKPLELDPMFEGLLSAVSTKMTHKSKKKVKSPIMLIPPCLAEEIRVCLVS